jgi:hypothetical protein
VKIGGYCKRNRPALGEYITWKGSYGLIGNLHLHVLLVTAAMYDLRNCQYHKRFMAQCERFANYLALGTFPRMVTTLLSALIDWKRRRNYANLYFSDRTPSVKTHSIRNNCISFLESESRWLRLRHAPLIETLGISCQRLDRPLPMWEASCHFIFHSMNSCPSHIRN